MSRLVGVWWLCGLNDRGAGWALPCKYCNSLLFPGGANGPCSIGLLTGQLGQMAEGQMAEGHRLRGAALASQFHFDSDISSSLHI